MSGGDPSPIRFHQSGVIFQHSDFTSQVMNLHQSDFTCRVVNLHHSDFSIYGDPSTFRFQQEFRRLFFSDILSLIHNQVTYFLKKSLSLLVNRQVTKNHVIYYEVPLKPTEDLRYCYERCANMSSYLAYMLVYLYSIYHRPARSVEQAVRLLCIDRPSWDIAPKL